MATDTKKTKPVKRAKPAKTAAPVAQPRATRPNKKALTCPTVTRQWQLIDCTDQPVGRLATQIAILLRGKHRPQFAPHMDNGDFVVAINTSKLRLTGRKLEDKMYWRHSGYMGGIKSKSAKEIMATKPGEILTTAVKGMLPHNALCNKLMTKLKVYPGTEHPHTAQFEKAATSTAA